jgi:hypothetical protein
MINFNQLPLTVSGLSEINNYPVDAPVSLRAGNFALRKRSVLVNEVVIYQDPSNAANTTELVTSTSAVVYCNKDSKCYYYNPVGVTKGYETVVNDKNVVGVPGPISEINVSGDPTGSTQLTANYLEQRQGTLFFYETVE